MGGMKKLLIEMQDAAYEALMDHSFSSEGVRNARIDFLSKYPQNEDIFDEVALEILRDGSATFNENEPDWDRYKRGFPNDLKEYK